MNADDERVALRDRVALTDEGHRTDSDALAVEAPLEIRIGGVPIAVVMRTPGLDEALVRGFLITEGIAGPAEVRSVRHCTTAQAESDEDNVVQVVLEDGVQVDIAALRRNLFASSSCGICGKASIEQAMRVAGPFASARVLSREFVLGLPERLRATQEVFGRTGALHGAGLFAADGAAVEPITAEDVGRHNAVDKVVGLADRGGQRLDDRVLVVSGRVSFEVVQKALAARIPAIAAVSAPTSLAVDLALESRMTLVGFVRERRMCVYSGEVE